MSKKRNRRVNNTLSIVFSFNPENNDDLYFIERFIFKYFKKFLFNLYYDKNILEYRKFFLRIKNKFKL